jgi:hypothetical protein
METYKPPNRDRKCWGCGKQKPMMSYSKGSYTCRECSEYIAEHKKGGINLNEPLYYWKDKDKPPIRIGEFALIGELEKDIMAIFKKAGLIDEYSGNCEQVYHEGLHGLWDKIRNWKDKERKEMGMG